MNTSYKIRSVFIFLIFCAFYLIILGNLYSIQIKQRHFFINLGQQQYNVTVTIPPARGLIYDRTGKQLLTVNKEYVSAFIMPKKLQSIDTLEQFLKKHFPHALERLHTNLDNHFMFIKRKLSSEQIALLEHEKIADIHLLKEPHRYYPFEATASLVGITDIDNNGLFGIEALLNERLSGAPSTFSLEKDARSGHFYFQRETKVEGTPGLPVTLTIDADLQFLAYEDLKETISEVSAQEGSVLIMNPMNGEIIVMTQYPGFDPNNTESLNLAYTKNKCVTEVYELGSVMKVFAGLAALEENVVQPDELIDCQDSKITYVDGFKISTWKAHGIIPFREVIQQSNNIGIAKVTQRLEEKMYDHYKKLGFGSKSGLSWPGEQTGFVNPPEKWSRQSIISLSFGYEITANIVQLAKAFSLFANNGCIVTPKITIDPASASQQSKPLYSPQSIALMRDILEKTVTEGTARKAAMQGYTVLGKTGTANMVIDGAYNKDHNVYTFAGIVEKGDYKRVIITFIKDVKNAHQQNLYASSIAVPLFERVAEHMLIHDAII